MSDLTVTQLIKREIKLWPAGEEFLMVAANVEPVDFSDITKKRRKDFSIIGASGGFRLDLKRGVEVLDWKLSKISKKEWESK